MRIETDRLVLRSLKPSDVEPLIALWTDPDVTRFLGGPRDPEEVRRVLKAELADPPTGPLGQWPLIEKSTDEVVGDCGLIEKEIDGTAQVELVYVIARSAWSRGYATEIGTALLDVAFGTIGLDHVVSLVETDNLASRRVAGKLGMHMRSPVMRPDGVERELWSVHASRA